MKVEPLENFNPHELGSHTAPGSSSQENAVVKLESLFTQKINLVDGANVPDASYQDSNKTERVIKLEPQDVCEFKLAPNGELFVSIPCSDMVVAHPKNENTILGNSFENEGTTNFNQAPLCIKLKPEDVCEYRLWPNGEFSAGEPSFDTVIPCPKNETSISGNRLEDDGTTVPLDGSNAQQQTSPCVTNLPNEHLLASPMITAGEETIINVDVRSTKSDVFCDNLQNTHSPINPRKRSYELRNCNLRLKYRSKLQGTSPNTVLTCLHCISTFPCLESLRKHHLHHESVEISNTCSQCNQTFSECTCLKYHVKEHMPVDESVQNVGHGEQLQLNNSHPYNTNGCRNKKYPSSRHIKPQRKCSSGKCVHCGKSFISRRQFAIHQGLHTEDTNMHYNSRQCQKAVVIQSQPTKYIMPQPSNNKTFPQSCSHRGKTIKIKQELETQSVLHSIGKPHKCSLCGWAFRQIGSLKEHILSHTGEKPLKCGLCGKAFRRRTHLRTHTLLHTGKKHFKCSQCGKAFIQKGQLKIHILIHSKIKPHKCSECGKAFSQKGYIKYHMMIHTGEKPHKCNECGHLFRLKSDMMKHIMIHRGEKPYHCFQCGKSFSRSTHLNAHVLCKDL